jgi:8-oxo-dGTP pyrophosphatase MutT (NUDIX family)
MPSVTLHPRRDDHVHPVVLRHPSVASPLPTWDDSQAIAQVVPDGVMPTAIGGIPVQRWAEPPRTAAAWEQMAQPRITEPDWLPPKGCKAAAGVVTVDTDGRVWVVAPSNGYAGYRATFPKGTVDPGMSLQATALREAFEESGLHVRLARHLVDVRRSQSYTRYYLAERVGGDPAQMGWESQAVMLVPPARLAQVVHHPNDQPILAALAAPAP